MAGNGYGMVEETGDTCMKVNELFQSDMILQQGKPCCVWGTGKAGTVVTVTIQGNTASAPVQTAENEAEGEWKAVLPALAVSEAETMCISDGTEEILLKNIAVGEVWIAGGQSNMEFWMRYEKHVSEEKKNCTNPQIRFYDVPEIAYDGQREDFDYSKMAVWRTCTEENLDYFSGVGYFFAKKLQQDRKVPVGIIGCNWGGTTASAWMKEESVHKVGKPWIEDHEKAKEAWDMEEYWKTMHGYVGNSTGNPFESPFNEHFLPKTPSKEEIQKFFADVYQGGFFDPKLLTLGVASFPGTLYEHMLKPLAPFGMRGAIWYQGESDEPHAEIYAQMLTQLIADWRELWNEDFPFLMVQLPGYESWLDGPQTRYSELREAQRKTADTVNNCWLTSISDAGEQFDIHPKDKKTPGERLALLAEGKVYGMDLLCEAPYPVDFKVEEGSVRISFKNASGGLSVEGDRLNALELVPQQEFSWKIEGENLLLTIPNLKKGTQIRFATQLFYLVNLKNKAGIPAMPFECTI